MNPWGHPTVITNLVLAGATVGMAIFTAIMAYQTKRAVDEPRKKEVEQAFQSLFLALRKDIVTFDSLYIGYQYGDLRISDFSNVEAIKKSLGNVTDVEFYSINKIDSLLEKVLLDSSLFKEIDGIKTWIMLAFYEIKRHLQTIENDSDKSKIINNLIPNGLIKIRFHLIQLACYFICEAERRGYKELASAMKEITEFEPDETMQRDIFRKTNLPSEYNDFACCRTENLMEKAREKAEQNSVLKSLE